MSARGSSVLFILLFVTGFPLLSNAQSSPSLTGRVIDSRSGAPIAGAAVTIAGLSGIVRTDAGGAFTWRQPPSPPFQVIVILPGGQVASPVEIKTLGEAPVDVAVDSVAKESITVIGSAPSITSSPASATALLPGEQIARRNPENLMQALETVPGINAVSEGHATVPAIRGLARGRTLVLIDGARVTSERRVGPSATFADLASFEGIDIARGPGSVAYGSDALGGVISVRTRRAVPGSPLAVRGSATIGGGIPEGRGAIEISKGLARGGVLVQAHIREAGDWDSPLDDSAIVNSGWKDRGLLARAEW